MRCGKPEHQPGQKCPAKNAKCKECHKIGHFHKVCQSKKRGRRVNLVQTPPQDDDDTHKKHMIDISPRVQRLIVRSFPYLPFKVVYKKGTDIPVADALSSVTPMDPEDNIQLPIMAVNMITTQILMSVESQVSFSNKLD